MQDPNWSLRSWRDKHAAQQPHYSCLETLEQCAGIIRRSPPLVFRREIEYLKKQFALAARGEKFILQGGDCAERFIDCNENAIKNKIKILQEMSFIVSAKSGLPTIPVGRIAGQYAKPRSSPTETVAGCEVPVYRGDMINSFTATKHERQADPLKLQEGYLRSARTLDVIRALAKEREIDQKDSRNEQSIAEEKGARAHRGEERSFSQINPTGLDLFTSHEGLLLTYEEALTQWDATSKSYYNLGAHMLWVGERTRQLDGAHIEYCRGIANPIGIKIGPGCDSEELVNLIIRLNPCNELGKITLITRFGAGIAKKCLPKLIQAVQEHKLEVCWSCDPMHGNTITTATGVKTRVFSKIIDELKEVFHCHKRCRSILAGVHFEMTHIDVTECVGGEEMITTADLGVKYETYCDPRLNHSQSLELAYYISALLDSPKGSSS